MNGTAVTGSKRELSTGGALGAERPAMHVTSPPQRGAPSQMPGVPRPRSGVHGCLPHSRLQGNVRGETRRVQAGAGESPPARPGPPADRLCESCHQCCSVSCVHPVHSCFCSTMAERGLVTTKAAPACEGKNVSHLALQSPPTDSRGPPSPERASLAE